MAKKAFTITKVPASPVIPDIIRVAAYARVSSDKDAAFHSLEAQIDYYSTYVSAHPDWELVDIYSDDGISGTLLDRPEFTRMMDDARAGKIDRIVTKSITRFARNTVVLLDSIRELKHYGVDVYFEKEDLHSISPDGELLLTMLAMYAEEEARSASENQKWRIKKKFEQGQTTVGRMLGYRLVDGVLTIVPEEAEIVRKIFADFIGGKSILRIAKELSGISSPARSSRTWSRNTVASILQNDKYTGNMILQKTYCPDFRTKKQVINNGEVRKYEVIGSHDAIISEEDFTLAQQKLAENRANQTIPKSDGTAKHLFTGIIKCGQCGSVYVKRSNGTGKYRHFVWTCYRFTAYTKSACTAQAIPEDILIAKTKEVLGLKPESELTRDTVIANIKKITVPAPHTLTYQLKDGTEQEIIWEHKSRSESWTPEMRQAAAERAKKQAEKRRKQQGIKEDQSITNNVKEVIPC